MVYWTVYTQAHSENTRKNTVGGDVPQKPLNGVGALEGTAIRVPANAFTINVNSTNGNTSIKTAFS